MPNRFVRKGTEYENLLKTNYTAPPSLIDNFVLKPGVSLTENGKTKQEKAKKSAMDDKGRMRMTKTEYAAMSHKTIGNKTASVMKTTSEANLKPNQISQMAKTAGVNSLGQYNITKQTSS